MPSAALSRSATCETRSVGWHQLSRREAAEPADPPTAPETSAARVALPSQAAVGAILTGSVGRAAAAQITAAMRAIGCDHPPLNGFSCCAECRNHAAAAGTDQTLSAE